MTFEQLEILLELSKTHSMSTCAESMHTTKANISRAITGLEQELSLKLFFKSRRGSFLTPAGEQVAMYAERLMTNRSNIEELGQRSTEGAVLDVFFNEAQAHMAEELCAILAEKVQPSLLQLICMPVPHIRDAYSYMKPDIMFGVIPKADLGVLDRYRPGFSLYVIYESPHMVVFNPTHTPVDKIGDTITLQDLGNAKLLLSGSLFAANHSHTSSFRSFAARHNLDLDNPIVQVNLSQLINRYIDCGSLYITDGFDIEINFKERIASGRYQAARVIPEETALRYIIISNASPYYSEISEALAVLHNKLADEFMCFKRIY